MNRTREGQRAGVIVAADFCGIQHLPPGTATPVRHRVLDDAPTH